VRFRITNALFAVPTPLKNAKSADKLVSALLVKTALLALVGVVSNKEDEAYDM